MGSGGFLSPGSFGGKVLTLGVCELGIMAGGTEKGLST